MMKKILILICFLVVGHLALAQKDSLAFDEQGKYVYYKLINTGSNTPDVLYARATEFVKTAYKGGILKMVDHNDKALSVTGEGYMMVTRSGSIAKHDDGRITCKLIIEVKDAKYRYRFTDFVYTPYERDRYSNYVPQIGLNVEIEKAGKKLSPKDVDHYLDECAKFSRQVGAKLQQFMLAKVIAKKDTVAKKVISTNKW